MKAALGTHGPTYAERLAGTPLVLLLDVDGTLAPIAPRPQDAIVPLETRRVIAALAARNDVRVALVSGRAAADARRMVSVAGVWVIGNHGAEVISPAGDLSMDPRVERYVGPMAQVARKLTKLLAHLPQVLLEEKGATLSVHYRLAEPRVMPRLRSALEELVTQHGLRLSEGKCVYEVRPPVSIDKGTAIMRLARELGALDEGASVLFAGDDTTDEDAFRLLRARIPRAVTIRVGDGGSTDAEFLLPDPTAVLALLEWILSTR